MKVKNLKTMLFVFILCSINLSAQTWNGLWMVDNKNTLKISNENIKSFHFELVANGIKDIEGDATITGTTATYTLNKKSMRFDLAVDTTFVQISYVNSAGKTLRFVYKMSNEDFFTRLNKQVAEPPQEKSTVEKSKAKTEQAPASSSAENWTGEWKIGKNMWLKISNIKNNSFTFAFDCTNGTNVGQLEGSATINGNTAVYKDKENKDICPIIFTLLENSLVVAVDRTKNSDCWEDAGNGVTYAGTYKNSKAKITNTKVTKATGDSGFESFWNEFKSAVVKNDKNKVADMINFPLLGDYSSGFYDEKSNTTLDCDKNSFIKIGYQTIFKYYTEQFKSVKNIKSGNVNKDVKYKFTSFETLAKDDSLPDFLKIYKSGYELKLYSSKSHEGEFMMCFYFVNINGIYKLVGTQFAG